MKKRWLGAVLGILFLGFGAFLAVEMNAGEPELSNMGNGICQQKNGLMWQVSSSEKFSSAQEAQDYVSGMNLGDHTDWRLPTKNELYDLCDIFELSLEGDCPIRLKGGYWLQDRKVQAGEWEAYPMCGGSEYKYLKRKNGRVMAVRP